MLCIVCHMFFYVFKVGGIELVFFKKNNTFILF